MTCVPGQGGRLTGGCLLNQQNCSQM